MNFHKNLKFLNLMKFHVKAEFYDFFVKCEKSVKIHALSPDGENVDIELGLA